MNHALGPQAKVFVVIRKQVDIIENRWLR